MKVFGVPIDQLESLTEKDSGDPDPAIVWEGKGELGSGRGQVCVMCQGRRGFEPLTIHKATRAIARPKKSEA
jgi:hypothetical protein